MFISYSFHSEAHNFIHGFLSLYVMLTNKYTFHPGFLSLHLLLTSCSFHSWLSASSRFPLCCPQLNQMRKLKATKKAIIVKMTGRALEIPEDGLYCARVIGTMILLKSASHCSQTAGHNSCSTVSGAVSNCLYGLSCLPLMSSHHNSA